LVLDISYKMDQASSMLLAILVRDIAQDASLHYGRNYRVECIHHE
jgi:hypothetical protein